jgi:hypothetical protein
MTQSFDTFHVTSGKAEKGGLELKKTGFFAFIPYYLYVAAARSVVQRGASEI